ncbi:hypothetical protein ACOMHN_009658 [Nucella lapillus]
MTTTAELSESEGETEVQADTPKQIQVNKTPALETSNSTQKQAKSTRRPLTHKHHQTTQPLTIFEDHPVTIEEEAGSSTTSLRSLDWKMNDILRGMIGTVLSIKPLSPNKILVGCQSKLQQGRLTKIKKDRRDCSEMQEAKIILHQRETMQEPQQEPAWRTISPPNSYAGVVQGAHPIPKPRKRTLPTGNSKPTQQPTPAPTTPNPTDNAMMEALLTALNDLKKKSLTYRKKTGACKKEWLTKTTKTNRQGKIQPTQDRKTSTSKRSSAPAKE